MYERSPGHMIYLFLDILEPEDYDEQCEWSIWMFCSMLLNNNWGLLLCWYLCACMCWLLFQISVRAHNSHWRI